MRELTIDGKRISDDDPCYVIAEIGHNHGGNITTAKRMIESAADAGVDAVKFQKRDNETLYSRELLDQPYDNENSYGATYGAHRAALELDHADYTAIAWTANHHRVSWFATAFDEKSADFLASIGAPAFKIASGGLTDYWLLRYVGQFGKPIILSTGGGTWKDVDIAVDALTGTRSPFAVLHCTASYPCEFHELNLNVIAKMRDRYPGTVIGWSGHDNGIAMAMIAYTLGARIIEKHFTLNRAMKGTDHAFSLEPAGMKKLCRDLSRARFAMGDGEKRWYASERKPISKMRRVATAEGFKITGHLEAR